MANVAEGPAIARQIASGEWDFWCEPGPGRLSAGGRVRPAGALFHRDVLDGCELRSSCVGLAGLAAIELGSANELSGLRLTRMTAEAGEESV
jgi:hypothetical protein